MVYRLSSSGSVSEATSGATSGLRRTGRSLGPSRHRRVSAGICADANRTSQYRGTVQTSAYPAFLAASVQPAYRAMHVFPLGEVAGSKLIFQLWEPNPDYDDSQDELLRSAPELRILASFPLARGGSIRENDEHGTEMQSLRRQ